MPEERRRDARFWRSVVERVLLIALFGWLVVLWFQGCLVPSARDQMKQEQQKVVPAEPGPPP